MTILEALSEGLKKTPRQALVAFLVIIGLALLFPLVFRIYRAVSGRKDAVRWDAEFQALVRKKNLTINEIDLLGRLSAYLADTRRKALLLTNPNTFRSALARLEAKEKRPADHARALTDKLFGNDDSILPEEIDDPMGRGRPARYRTEEGLVYSGKLGGRNGSDLVIVDVVAMKGLEKRDDPRLFVQDFRGVSSYPVVSAARTEPDAFTVRVSSDKPKKKERISLSSIHVYPPGSADSLPTHLLSLDEGTGVIENPGGVLSKGDAVKLAFMTDQHRHYRVNAIVTGLSRKRRAAYLRFGYLKRTV